MKVSEATYQGRPCKYGHAGIRYSGDKHCVECAARKGAEYYAKSGRFLAADRHRRNKYGLSPLQFREMITTQQGLCAICRSTLVEGSLSGAGLVVDHSHTSGAVRGLLCNHCNRGLGLFADDPERLLAAATYLKETTK